MRPVPARGVGALTKREVEVLRLLGQGLLSWRLAHVGADPDNQPRT
jgi:DNA-binding CsgD family transcriptional regulator